MADPTTRKPDPSSTDAVGRGTPYGPQPHGVDEAAGGADSSPHETEPTSVNRSDATRRPPDIDRTRQSDPGHR